MAQTTTTPATTRLAHVNVPPAETWNYLRVNDVALTVSAPRGSGEVLARLPHALAKVECGVGDEAVAWVESVAGDAAYVEVKAGETREEPIIVRVSAGEHVDTGVLVRRGATATIAVLATDGDAADEDGDAADNVSRASATDGVACEESPARDATSPSDSATLLRIIAEREAHVSVIEIVANRGRRTHLGGIGITADNDAVIDVRQYAFGHGSTALGIATDLAGEGTTLTHAMRYLVGSDDALDVNHLVRQRGCGTVATVVTSGVLADGATKTMRETIDLVRGAKGAAGSEVETVLVAGDNVVNKTLPTILCDEEDVSGNHGASIGGVSAEQRGYLSARGLSDEAVDALFVRAVFDDAIIHAPSEECQETIVARMTDVLGNEAADDAVEMLDNGAPDVKGRASGTETERPNNPRTTDEGGV